MKAIPALSIRQPWAHAIVHLGKDIENRNRAYSHRGPVFIHASAGLVQDEYLLAEEFMLERGVLTGGLPDFRDISRGGIIGIAEIVDAVRASDSPWWMGPCGLVLRNARPLPFVACKGTVTPMFWSVPGEALERLHPHI